MDSCNKVSSWGYSPGLASADERGGSGLGAPSNEGTGGFAASDLVGAFSLSEVVESWLEGCMCVGCGDGSLRGCGGAGGSDGVGNCERTICRFALARFDSGITHSAQSQVDSRDDPRLWAIRRFSMLAGA